MCTINIATTPPSPCNQALQISHDQSWVAESDIILKWCKREIVCRKLSGECSYSTLHEYLIPSKSCISEVKFVKGLTCKHSSSNIKLLIPVINGIYHNHVFHASSNLISQQRLAFSFKWKKKWLLKHSEFVMMENNDESLEDCHQKEKWNRIPPPLQTGGSIECLESGGCLDLLWGIGHPEHGPGGGSNGRPQWNWLGGTLKWSGHGGPEWL